MKIIHFQSRSTSGTHETSNVSSEVPDTDLHGIKVHHWKQFGFEACKSSKSTLLATPKGLKYEETHPWRSQKCPEQQNR